MPLTLTPEQRQEALAKGYNPDEYVFLTPEEAAQTELLPETSAVGAAVRTAIEQAPGLAAGVLAAKAGRALGFFGRAAKLGSPAGIASVVAEPLVAMGAGYLGQKSVEAMTDGAPWWTVGRVDAMREARLKQEADLKQHPYAQMVGAIGGQLPLGAPIPSRAARSGIGRILGTQIGRTEGATLSEAEKFAMAQMAVNPAAVAGVTVGVPLSQGQPVDPGFAAAQIALAALQGSPWRGEAAPPRWEMGPEVKMPKNLPDVIRAMRDRGMEITPETLRETLPGQLDETYRQMVGYAGEMQGPLIPQAGEVQGPMINVSHGEQFGPEAPKPKISKRVKAAINKMVPQSETPSTTPYTEREPMYQDATPNQVSLEQRLINERMAPAWNRLAAERGMAVEEGPVDDTGKHRGMHVPRSSVGEMSRAVIDPTREISTTRPHEQAHETMNFMQRFGSKAERARAQELLDAYGQDHEAMAETAAEQAIQLDIGAGRGNIPTNKLGRWQNFLRTWRLRFGKGSKEDLQNYMLEKMLNDPTYFERMGIPVPESVMAAAGGSGARMQDVKPQPEMSPEDAEAFRKLRQTVDEAAPVETKPGQPIDYAAGREAELRLRNRNARYQDVKPGETSEIKPVERDADGNIIIPAGVDWEYVPVREKNAAGEVVITQELVPTANWRISQSSVTRGDKAVNKEYWVPASEAAKEAAKYDSEGRLIEKSGTIGAPTEAVAKWHRVTDSQGNVHWVRSTEAPSGKQLTPEQVKKLREAVPAGEFISGPRKPRELPLKPTVKYEFAHGHPVTEQPLHRREEFLDLRKHYKSVERAYNEALQNITDLHRSGKGGFLGDRASGAGAASPEGRKELIRLQNKLMGLEDEMGRTMDKMRSIERERAEMQRVETPEMEKRLEVSKRVRSVDEAFSRAIHQPLPAQPEKLVPVQPSKLTKIAGQLSQDPLRRFAPEQKVAEFSDAPEQLPADPAYESRINEVRSELDPLRDQLKLPEGYVAPRSRLDTEAGQRIAEREAKASYALQEARREEQYVKNTAKQVERESGEVTLEKFKKAVDGKRSKRMSQAELEVLLGVSADSVKKLPNITSTDPNVEIEFAQWSERINKMRLAQKHATEAVPLWQFSEDPQLAAKEYKIIEQQAKNAVQRWKFPTKEARDSFVADVTNGTIERIQTHGIGENDLSNYARGAAKNVARGLGDRFKIMIDPDTGEKIRIPRESSIEGTAENVGSETGEGNLQREELVSDSGSPIDINKERIPIEVLEDIASAGPATLMTAKDIGFVKWLKEQPANVPLTRLELKAKYSELSGETLDLSKQAEGLGNAFVVEQPPTRKGQQTTQETRFQTISSDRSPMRPSEINLSNPSDVYKPGEKTPSEDSLVGRDRLFGSVTDKVARTLGASGKIVSDVTNRTLSQARKEQHWFNEAIDAVKGLKDKEVLEVYKTIIAEDRSGENYSGDLPTHLRPAYNEWRRIYREMGEERLAAKQPVMGPDGKLRQRELLDSAFFNMTRRDVIEELNAHPTSAKSERLKADYINHQIKMLTTREGYTEAEAQTAAQERLSNYLDAIRQGGSLKESAAFSANRRTEGVGLPDSWIDPDPMNAWKRYVTRYAYDAAYWDNVETNPAAMKALGRSKNLYGQDVPFTAEHENIQPVGGPDVQYLEQAMQGKQNQGHNKGIDAFSNLVNTVLTPGWSTGIWDNITTVGKQMGYAKEQLPKLLGAYSKALGDLATGAEDSAYRRALSQGYIRKGRTIYEDLAEGQTAWADRWNKYANIIRKGNLREFSETISRTLSQAGGEVIGTAMRGAAEGGDKTAIDTLTRMWGGDGWKKATLAEIGTKFGEQVQGRYDVTELPRWAFDSALAPYVKMSRWNIGQGNNFVKYLLDPVYKNPQDVGAWTRLLTATLGSGLAGLAIAELKEQIGGRKQNVPTWDELAKADQRITQGTLLKLAVTSDLAGTFGMWGSLTTMAQQKLAGNQAMGVGFPMADSAERIAKETSAFVSALIADPSLENVEDIMPRYVLNVGKTFVGGSSLIESVAKRAAGDEEYQTDLDTSNANRDMRMYSMLEEGKIKPSLGSNPDYEKLPERTFKRDRTPTGEEAGHMAERIIRRAGGRPEKALEEMESLERMPVRLMPSMTSNPEDFIRYAKWLRETQGETAMRQRIQKYVAQQGLNEQKKAMLEQSLLSRLARR